MFNFFYGEHKMPKREYDPLSVIPSITVIRQRLEKTNEQARRLRILLRTAERIERDGRQSATTNAGQRPQAVERAETARGRRVQRALAAVAGRGVCLASDMLAEQAGQV